MDPQARHIHKTVHRRQDGFKAHVAVEPETGITTACELTKGAGSLAPDGATGIRLMDADGTLPSADDLADGEVVDVLGDSAYATGEALDKITKAGCRPLVKPGPFKPAVEGGSRLMTSASMRQQAPRPARTASPARSPRAGLSSSEQGASAVRCGPSAPPRRPAGPCTCTSTRRCSASTVTARKTLLGRRTTANTGRWWNAPSRGSSPAGTAKFATAASRRTTTGSTTAAPL